MKRFTAITAASLFLAIGLGSANAQTTLNWDVTSGTPGFVTPGSFGDGTWDSSTTANWNPNSDGSGTNVTWNDAASPANNAVINVAGGSTNNGAGWVDVDAGITIAAGTRTTNTVTVGNAGGGFQWVELQGGGTISAPNGLTILSGTKLTATVVPGFLNAFAGVIDTGTNNLTINSGAELHIGLPGTGGGAATLNGAGRVVLNGGTMWENNAGNAGSFVLQAKNLEVNGTGTIGYDDTNTTPDNQVSIINGGIIFGTGGDPSTGGAGTLIKTGPDQIGFAYRADTGNGQSNAAQNSFAKLKVIQGTFRLRNANSVVDERLFGAVPVATLADAITLDGPAYTVGTVTCPGACAGIGSNLTVALDAKRGITFGPNGGYFDNGAGAGLTIPGPISGSGPMAVGSPTTTSAANVTFTLSNANNVNTFSGDVIGYRATLKLSSSLKANGLKDGSSTQQPTNNSTITIDTGNTLTSGVNGGGGTWSAVISGAGGYTKMGAGTEILAGANTYTGDTKVQGGTLQINNAYLADAADVYLSTGSIFNLNTAAATDTIRSLFIDGAGQAIGTWGALGSGAAHTSALFSGNGILNVTTAATPPGIPGDYNGNGSVDAADYVLWRNGGPLLNDNTPGTVDASDYTFWKANFGNHAGSGSGLSSGAAVPEPSSICLVLLSVCGLISNRRSR